MYDSLHGLCLFKENNCLDFGMNDYVYISYLYFNTLFISNDKLYHSLAYLLF